MLGGREYATNYFDCHLHSFDVRTRHWSQVPLLTRTLTLTPTLTPTLALTLALTLTLTLALTLAPTLTLPTDH